MSLHILDLDTSGDHITVSSGTVTLSGPVGDVLDLLDAKPQLRAVLDDTDGLFASNGPRSSKIHCVPCGATGYPGGDWQDTHRRGHLPCANGCGKLLTVTVSGGPRAHTRCPLERVA